MLLIIDGLRKGLAGGQCKAPVAPSREAASIAARASPAYERFMTLNSRVSSFRRPPSPGNLASSYPGRAAGIPNCFDERIAPRVRQDSRGVRVFQRSQATGREAPSSPAAGRARSSPFPAAVW